MTTITIPPRAVEAAARAGYELTRDEALADHGIIASVTYCPWEELSDDGKEYYMTHARTAIAASLNAWPGVEHQTPNEWSNKPHIILPLHTENPNAES